MQKRATAKTRASSASQKATALTSTGTGRRTRSQAELAAVSPTDSGEITLGGHADRGLTLAALYDTGILERLRLEVRVRLVVDLTESLSWLHANPRLMAAHPHLLIAPSSIVIGLDGVARVDVRAAKKGSSERGELEATYRAPELSHAGAAGDHRADIFSVGVLAWEAVAGTRLGALAERASKGQRAPQVPEPPRHAPELALPTEAHWALPCAELALDATSIDPAQRPHDCQALLARLAAIDRTRLATHQEIAEAVQGITALSTLCAPIPTLPSPDAACLTPRHAESFGAFACDAGEQAPAACFQAPTNISRATPQPTPEPSELEPERAPAPLGPAARQPAPAQLHPSTGSHSARTWFAVALLWLAVIGTIAGYMASLLAR